MQRGVSLIKGTSIETGLLAAELALGKVKGTKTIVLITHEKEIDAYAKNHILIKDWLIVDKI